jgi:predicted nucleic acid-binding protein
MRLFLDSSAFLKHYIDEPGSSCVRARLREADALVLSVIAWPEIISALNRLQRGGALGDEDYGAVKRELEEDFGNAAVVALSAEVLERTARCLEIAPLRASDAIHVASAIEAGVDRFVSADRRQCKAARAMGLRVELVGDDTSRRKRRSPER